jgi:predicted aconitase
MQLTDEEKRMYDGVYGPIVARAMDYLVKLGEACDAESLLDISYAHVDPGVAYHHIDIDETLELAEAGAKVVVPTSTTQHCIDMEQWQNMGVPEGLAQRQLSIIPAHQKMGIAGTYSCTPYLIGYLPPKGSHIASIESSAVIYFNSLLGARSNRDGPFAIYAALTGKYPACGYHLKENRKATHLFRVETKLSGPTDYGALGFHIGALVGDGVPVITGLVSARQEELIALGAAMATSGQVALYHIPGVTAEWRTFGDMFAKSNSHNEFSIGAKEIFNVYEKLHTAKDNHVDFVDLGCPHYTLEQVRKTASLIRGRKVHGNVKLWVFTSRAIKAIADRTGYSATIKDAGGLVVCDCCGTSSHLRQTVCREYNMSVPSVNITMTDSVKQCKYANDSIGSQTILAKVEDCIEAAITGRGVAGWKK